MDKEILRIIIIATGLIIVIVMLSWGYLKDRQSHEELDDAPEDIAPPAEERISTTNKFVEMKDKPVEMAVVETAEKYYSTDEDDEEEEEDVPVTPRMPTPAIIQFCLVAKAGQGFNGADLIRAFRIAGLKYGSLKIFERLDANQLVDFGVASMVAPGTFPSTDLDSYYCSGIIFFMQPDELEDAAAVFDDYVETIRMLAIELEGEVWDHQRKPLTEATVRAIRQSL